MAFKGGRLVLLLSFAVSTEVLAGEYQAPRGIGATVSVHAAHTARPDSFTLFPSSTPNAQALENIDVKDRNSRARDVV